MNLIARREWGARAPKSTSVIGPVIGVALHWEGPRMGAFGHDACAGKVQGIQRFHMDTRGWADIAYNFLVCPHGYVYEGRGVGRRSAANGTTDGNAKYYAVCGLFGDGDPLTPEMKQGYLDTINYLRANGAGQAVRAHSSFKPTACPGPQIRDWIVGGLSGGAVPTPTPTPAPPPTTHPPFAGRLIRLTRPRMHGADVRTWQNRMKQRGWNIGVDGVYGPESDGVCRKFQTEKGLGVDGIIGKNTWAATWQAPVT